MYCKQNNAGFFLSWRFWEKSCQCIPIKECRLFYTTKENSLTQSLTDTEKYTLLNHHVKPGNWYLPKKRFTIIWFISNILAESIPMAWLQRNRRWGFLQILYVICNICRPSVLVNSAMKYFNKARGILKGHNKKAYHITASVKAENFIKIMQEPQKAISLVFDVERSALMEKNPEAVPQYHLMFNVLWAAEYCLWGHVESAKDYENNPGNFFWHYFNLGLMQVTKTRQ